MNEPDFEYSWFRLDTGRREVDIPASYANSDLGETIQMESQHDWKLQSKSARHAFTTLFGLAMISFLIRSSVNLAEFESIE